MYPGQIILLSARVREGHILKAKFRLGGQGRGTGGQLPPLPPRWRRPCAAAAHRRPGDGCRLFKSYNISETQTTRSIFTQLFVHVIYGRGSVLLFATFSGKLSTSGFVDDVILAHKPIG